MFEPSREEGWTSFSNGELLRRAEQSFDVLLTADRRLEYQQHLSQFQIGIVVILTHNLRFRTIAVAVDPIREALTAVSYGEVVRVQVS